jgi:hypothetical protein
MKITNVDEVIGFFFTCIRLKERKVNTHIPVTKGQLVVKTELLPDIWIKKQPDIRPGIK